MNKTTLSEALAFELGFTKTEAKQIVDTTFKLMADALIHGDDINIAEFASFRIVDRPSKRYRNVTHTSHTEKC